MEQMGLSFEGHTCESEEHLRDFVSARWPRLRCSDDVNTLTIQDFAEHIKAVAPARVLLAGGPPCTPFSCLGQEKGFADANSEPLRAFFRLRDDLADFCARASTPFHWLMEEVASMTKSHRDDISHLAGAGPVLMHAADFGHVHRARLYWGIPDEHLRSRGAIECFREDAAAKGLKLVRWLGRPVPEAWQPSGGFDRPHRSTCGARAALVPGTGYAPTFPAGRFLAFTTVFPHPADRPPRDARDDPYVYQRFLDDGRRLPLFHYSKGNMVWKDQAARPLSADEREQLMGFPSGYTASLGRGKHPCQSDARCHAMGNTFHIPCIIVLLVLLFSTDAAAAATSSTSASPASSGVPSLPSSSASAAAPWCRLPQGWAAPTPTRAARRSWQEEHVPGTAWDDSRSWPPPSRQCGRALVMEALDLFPKELFPGRSGEQPICRALDAAELCDLSALQHFDRFLSDRGAPHGMTGPDIQALWAKSPMHAAVARQHRPSTSVSGEPNLVAPNLGPRKHVEAAQGIVHPFAYDPPLELDLQFSVAAYVALGLNVAEAREKNLIALRRLAGSVKELDDLARTWRPTSIPGAPGVRPVFAAVLVVLLRWPDQDLPLRLVDGFPLGGPIPPSAVLRPIVTSRVGAPVPAARDECLLGPDAAKFVDELEAKSCRFPLDRAPFDATVKEVQAGLAEPPVSRQAMDARYGVGGWRPLPRHVIEQHDKLRPIDDGRASHTNALSWVGESNVCIPPEFLVLVARHAAVAMVAAAGSLPEWFTMRGSIEDWWKGYRQVPPTRRHMALAIAAVRVPPHGHWGYAQLNGLPFGLGAAVNQFVRVPMLLTAAARRLLMLLCGHYVDDNGVLELASLGTSATDAFRELAEFMLGVKLSSEKRQAPAALCQFLGHLHDFRPLAYESAVVYDPRLGLREEIHQALQSALDSDFLGPGQAAKLRGKAQFLDTGLAGRPCRGALSAVANRQYSHESGPLSPACRLSLRFLQAVCSKAPSRAVHLLHKPDRPVLVYTDASAESHSMRVGMLVFSPGSLPLAFVHDVPESVAAPWRGEAEGINQGELYAANVLAWSAPDIFRGKDMIWFIDNTSAESALVKSGSATESMSRLALQAAAFFTALGARVWFEHIPSEDNPSDALSRAGFADPFVAQMIASGQWLRMPCRAPPSADSFVGAWDLLESLG